MKWLLLCLLSVTVVAEPRLLATMGAKKAAIAFDGHPVTVSVGETAHGVTLVAVNGDSAVVSAQGHQTTVRMGEGIYASAVNGSDAGSGSGGDEKMSLTSQGGHFWTQVGVGGTLFRGLIDTGATTLAFSYSQAMKMGLKIDAQTPTSLSETAQGIVQTWRVQIPQLKVGSTTLYNVEASVLKGDFPKEPLIGMSVLSHYAMAREGDSMTLSKRF